MSALPDFTCAPCHGYSPVSNDERADLLALSDATCPPGPWSSTAEYAGLAVDDAEPLPTADTICSLIRRMQSVPVVELSQIAATLATAMQYEAIGVTDKERKSLADSLRDVCLLAEDYES